ncbi:putative leader peptide [Micromonospora sp. RHAY321]|uniref:putative leader peptide n=1 Tax=Micromonospora sp. RHAY321 TaxID=2944807 RepID=UPI0035AFC83D
MARRRRRGAHGQRHRAPRQDRLIPICREGFSSAAPTGEELLTVDDARFKIGFVRSVHLTKRGHIDLLRVASAACRRSI